MISQWIRRSSPKKWNVGANGGSIFLGEISAIPSIRKLNSKLVIIHSLASGSSEGCYHGAFLSFVCLYLVIVLFTQIFNLPLCRYKTSKLRNIFDSVICSQNHRFWRFIFDSSVTAATSMVLGKLNDFHWEYDTRRHPIDFGPQRPWNFFASE